MRHQFSAVIFGLVCALLVFFAPSLAQRQVVVMDPTSSGFTTSGQPISIVTGATGPSGPTGPSGTTPSQIIGNFNDGNLASGMTAYMDLGTLNVSVNGGVIGTCTLVTDAPCINVTQAGTFQNWQLVTDGPQPGTGSLVFTLLKNGSATSLVITVNANAAAGTYTDTTHTVTVARGDTVSIKMVNSASAVSAPLGSISIGFTGS